MKKIYILPVFILLFFANCEKVIDVDVPSIDPKLIIDASFEVYFDESPVTANSVVKLRLSADYFDESIPTVANADVFLTDLTNNTIINFSDANLDGDYEPDSNFIPADNIVYELTVIYNNETYKGKATKIKSTPLTSVVQGDRSLLSGKEVELKVDFTDDGTLENYYLFQFTDQIFLTIEDRFFNGADYNFSYFLQEDEIELPTNITVKMSGISKEYYTYFRILLEQSGVNAGGPFQSVPSSLLGNMINTTNEANFPLGYFNIGETDSFNLDLVEKN
ncbi:DUF4249 domain-containing protein [Polaribacter pectinis]|uniref:DUF4249 domain-containing protein n=1 Tax=Polaribacter pectinis TaxID=2738844 RepID=A0A7G9LDX4_9FLAO|nr:DUF4249 family protein [Polaribacter pectinis]QNM86823.1 DUF4249 domain-containing protein [Polaribacter pectinis]